MVQGKYLRTDSSAIHMGWAMRDKKSLMAEITAGFSLHHQALPSLSEASHEVIKIMLSSTYPPSVRLLKGPSSNAFVIRDTH